MTDPDIMAAGFHVPQVRLARVPGQRESLHDAIISTSRSVISTGAPYISLKAKALDDRHLRLEHVDGGSGLRHICGDMATAL